MIKSPLRYPGGKSRGIAEIAARMPLQFAEYREPMVGGGSVFCYVRQQFPDVPCWINDLNYDLVCFWQAVQSDVTKLVEELHNVRNTETDGRVLFDRLRTVDKEAMTDFDRAVRFFVLNRITFSGTIEAGGFSQGAFAGRFTSSSIDRVRQLAPLLTGVRITYGDYEPLLTEPGENVFVFLDPPYVTATQSKLYGANGILHTGFDHERFGELVTACPHNYLITYDDAEVLRERFAGSTLYGWNLQYGMNNYKQEGAAIGAELMISNYEVAPPKEKAAKVTRSKGKGNPNAISLRLEAARDDIQTVRSMLDDNPNEQVGNHLSSVDSAIQDAITHLATMTVAKDPGAPNSLNKLPQVQHDTPATRGMVAALMLLVEKAQAVDEECGYVDENGEGTGFAGRYNRESLRVTNEIFGSAGSGRE